MCVVLISFNSLIWMSLMAATCLTWWLADGSMTETCFKVVVIIVAAIKARIVFQCFMEVRSLTLPWKFVFDGWVSVVAVIFMFGFVF